MRFLLDAHILIWFMAGSSLLGDDTRALLIDRRNRVFVSVVSGWEIAIKVGLGKLALPTNVHTWLPGELVAAGFDILPITLDHALAVELLLPLHHDPFDRLLIAQALAEDLTLVTADRQIQRYDVQVLPCS